MQDIDKKLFENLFFIRHGESTCNTFNRLAGKIDAPLTFLGKQQAHEAAKMCDGYTFDIVYVSPLQRAFETCTTILKHNNIPNDIVNIDTRLKERDFGSYTLENKSLLQKKYSITEYEKAVNLDSKTMQKSETFLDFSSRVEEFFISELIPILQEGKKVLVVAHKYVIELFFNFLADVRSEKKYDLRLPNAEVLQGCNVNAYLNQENEQINIFKEWLILKHHYVFIISALFGLLVNFLGLGFSLNPLILLFLLIVASSLTLSNTDIEDSYRFIFNFKAIKMNLLRYLILPLVCITLGYYLGYLHNDLFVVILIFISSPVAIITLSITRSVGGFILPTSSSIILSSFMSIIPLGYLFYILESYNIYSFFQVYGLVVLLAVFIPYYIVLQCRRLKPIQTAKIAQRQGYLAILLIAAFIFFITISLEDISYMEVFVALGISIILRVISILFVQNRPVDGIDRYIAMAYPNIFLISIITIMLNMDFIHNIVTLTIIPMFLLSIFDVWYSKKLYIDSSDERLYKILSLQSLNK